MKNRKQARIGQRGPKYKLSEWGVDGKSINLKSKGCDNLDRGSLKDLAKAHGSKELEWAEDAQKDEMSQGSPEAMEWAKKVQKKKK